MTEFDNDAVIIWQQGWYNTSLQEDYFYENTANAESPWFGQEIWEGGDAYLG